MVVGPLEFGLLIFDAQAHAPLLARLAEIAAVVSLFTTGLKLRVPWRDGRWRAPLRPAFVSNDADGGLVAVAGVYGPGFL